jgi:hypothetical protein
MVLEDHGLARGASWRESVANLGKWKEDQALDRVSRAVAGKSQRSLRIFDCGM